MKQLYLCASILTLIASESSAIIEEGAEEERRDAALTVTVDLTKQPLIQVAPLIDNPQRRKLLEDTPLEYEDLDAMVAMALYMDTDGERNAALDYLIRNRPLYKGQRLALAKLLPLDMRASALLFMVSLDLMRNDANDLQGILMALRETCRRSDAPDASMSSTYVSTGCPCHPNGHQKGILVQRGEIKGDIPVRGDIADWNEVTHVLRCATRSQSQKTHSDSVRFFVRLEVPSSAFEALAQAGRKTALKDLNVEQVWGVFQSITSNADHWNAFYKAAEILFEGKPEERIKAHLQLLQKDDQRLLSTHGEALLRDLPEGPESDRVLMSFLTPEREGALAVIGPHLVKALETISGENRIAALLAFIGQYRNKKTYTSGESFPIIQAAQRMLTQDGYRLIVTDLLDTAPPATLWYAARQLGDPQALMSVLKALLGRNPISLPTGKMAFLEAFTDQAQRDAAGKLILECKSLQNDVYIKEAQHMSYAARGRHTEMFRALALSKKQIPVIMLIADMVVSDQVLSELMNSHPTIPDWEPDRPTSFAIDAPTRYELARLVKGQAARKESDDLMLQFAERAVTTRYKPGALEYLLSVHDHSRLRTDSIRSLVAEFKRKGVKPLYRAQALRLDAHITQRKVGHDIHALITDPQCDPGEPLFKMAELITGYNLRQEAYLHISLMTNLPPRRRLEAVLKISNERDKAESLRQLLLMQAHTDSEYVIRTLHTLFLTQDRGVPPEFMAPLLEALILRKLRCYSWLSRQSWWKPENLQTFAKEARAIRGFDPSPLNGDLEKIILTPEGSWTVRSMAHALMSELGKTSLNETLRNLLWGRRKVVAEATAPEEPAAPLLSRKGIMQRLGLDQATPAPTPQPPAEPAWTKLDQVLAYTLLTDPEDRDVNQLFKVMKMLPAAQCALFQGKHWTAGKFIPIFKAVPENRRMEMVVILMQRAWVHFQKSHRFQEGNGMVGSRQVMSGPLFVQGFRSAIPDGTKELSLSYSLDGIGAPEGADLRTSFALSAGLASRELRKALFPESDV